MQCMSRCGGLVLVPVKRSAPHGSMVAPLLSAIEPTHIVPTPTSLLSTPHLHHLSFQNVVFLFLHSTAKQGSSNNLQLAATRQNRARQSFLLSDNLTIDNLSNIRSFLPNTNLNQNLATAASRFVFGHLLKWPTPFIRCLSNPVSICQPLPCLCLTDTVTQKHKNTKTQKYKIQNAKKGK